VPEECLPRFESLLSLSVSTFDIAAAVGIFDSRPLLIVLEKPAAFVIDQNVVIELPHLQSDGILCLIELSLRDQNILFGSNIRLVDTKQLG